MTYFVARLFAVRLFLLVGGSVGLIISLAIGSIVSIAREVVVNWSR